MAQRLYPSLKILAPLSVVAVVLASAYSYVCATPNSSTQIQTVQQQTDEAKALLSRYRGESEYLTQAKVMIDEVISIDKNYAPVYRELARYYLREGHIHSRKYRPGSLEAAENALKRAVEIDSKYADAYVLFGDLYYSMGRPMDGFRCRISSRPQ